MQYASFEDGFRDIYPRLVRTLMVACGDRELSCDIAQEALAKGYANWKKVNELEIPAAWVKKVAVNQLKDEFRKQAKRKTHASDTLELSTIETIEKSLPTPMAVDFSRALLELPPQQRIAAALSFVDDMSESEIAHTMGISKGSVKTHLHHARNALGASLNVIEI